MPILKIKYRTFDGFERAIAAQTAHFSALHPDVGFELSHGGPEKIYTEMVEHGGATGGSYDLMLTLTDWLPDLIRRKGLRSIDEYLASDPPADWPGGWSDSVLGLQRDAQGAIYGLPYHDGPEIFHYRTDLFDDAAEQTRFEQQHGYALRSPETWREFLDVARFFTRPDEQLYGTVVAGLNDGHNNVYDFLIHLWSRGGRLLDERLRPAFDSPSQQMRWSAGIAAAKDLIARGVIGQPTDAQVQVSVTTPWHMWPWLKVAPRLEIMYHSIHYLDSLRYLFGDPAWVTSRHAHYPGQPEAGETKTVTVLDYDSGLQALVAANHHDHSGDSYATFRFLGTEGLIKGTIGLLYNYPHGRPDTLQVHSTRLAPETWYDIKLEGLWIPDAFIGPIASLMDAIQSDGTPITDIADNLGTLRVVYAAYRSAQEHRSIRPEELKVEN